MLDEWIRKSVEPEEAKGKLIQWNTKVKVLLILLVSVGLLALLWPSSKGNVSPQISDSAAVQKQGDARAALSSELSSVLSQVEGAGTVQVSLTLASDGVKSYARNTREEQRDTKETDTTGGTRNIREDNVTSDVAVSSGKALLIEDQAPQVVGVLVVAEGATDARIQERLTDVTATLLNLSPNQVRVVARKGGTQ